ncbi:VWA domain-containing protein [Acidobacteria bacterium AH-259-D05]|nr:VWA domain-containing protein [Acidobacteria bacterium AH-259-D05]
MTEGHLLRNVVLFGRLLRRAGMDVTPTQGIGLVEALKHLDIRQRRDFKDAARTLLVNRREQLALFDQIFDLFWEAGKRKADSPDLGLLLQRSHQFTERLTLPPAEEHNWQQEKVEMSHPHHGEVRTYSSQEVLREKDLAALTAAELTQVKQLIQAMAWRLEQCRSRRRIQGFNGTHLDMRRTLRHNLRHGGEPILLRWRRPKPKRRPLVVLCDISGSMEPYSRLLLQFIYVISRGLKRVDAFVFGTQLTRVTHQLKERDVDRALEKVTGAIHDWAGGTRIGESLKTFNYQWARRVLGQGAIVLIISDGWDRGNMQLLEKEIARLQRSCQRLIWLNPLLGSPRYEPLTRGIQTALPYVDDFLPIHNLISLEQLGNLLERLSERRPLRRQISPHFCEVA